uniref:Glycosyltransferase n=1 Tax=Desertifilum tharense IPPAS B-1220 TaxID=1781255 RepID=A0ACD5GQF4_9CYAN
MARFWLLIITVAIATAEIVREYQAILPQHSQLRYCFEPEQGAAFARQKAVEEAQGELIGFLDDDNWYRLATGWWRLLASIRRIQKWAHTGANSRVF